MKIEASDISKILTGINIIIIGLYILLGNLGIVNFGYLPYLIKFWPLIIITIGLDLLLKNYNLNYIGTAIFTLFLIMALVASMPNQNGQGMRKFFRIPDEPTTLNNFWEGFAWIPFLDDGLVVETKNYNVQLEPGFGNIIFDLTDKKIGKVDVEIKNGSIPKIECEIGYKSKVKESEAKIITNQINTEATISIQTEGIEKTLSIKMVVVIPDTTGIVLKTSNPRQTNTFTILDDWKANVNLEEFKNGSLTAKNIDSNIKIQTISGDVEVGNVKSAWIHSASGSITIGKSEGACDLKSISGSIEAEGLAGGEIGTTSGSIVVGLNTSHLGIQTISGEVSVANSTSTLEIGTTSGDIVIDSLLVDKGEININSVSGGIELRIEKSSSIKGYWKSVSGDFNISGGDFSQIGDDRSFKVGEGKAVLYTNTTSGDIYIKVGK
jgi:hypothetical protein